MDACRPNTQAGGPTQPGRDELGPLLPIPAKYSLKKWNEKSIEKDLKISSENAEFDYLYIICYNIVGVLIFMPSAISPYFFSIGSYASLFIVSVLYKI